MVFSLEQFQRHLALAGYQVCDVPVVERADLFSTKGGDRIIERLLTFDYGNSEYALRPEFTASAARIYAGISGKIARWQFCGPVFEDRSDNGTHAFQRHSIGAELLDMAGPIADSEIIALAISGLYAQGVTGFRLMIGHAGLTRKLIERITTDSQLTQFLLSQRSTLADTKQGRQQVEKALHQILNLRSGGLPEESLEGEGLTDLLASVTLRTSTLGGRTRSDIARRLIRKQRRTEEASQILQGIELLEAWVSLSGHPEEVLPKIYQFGEDMPEFAALAADLRTTLELLAVAGISMDAITLQPDLNRIWEYYSGIVFEIQGENGQSLGGGGRYDGLLRLLGSAEDTPAVGFQLNADAIWKQTGYPDNFANRTTLALVGEQSQAVALTWWAKTLREEGFACAIYENVPPETKFPVMIYPDGAAAFGEHFASPQDLAAFLQERLPQ